MLCAEWAKPVLCVRDAKIGFCVARVKVFCKFNIANKVFANFVYMMGIITDFANYITCIVEKMDLYS